MKFVLICHDDEPLTNEGMARWLASFSELAGIVIISENSSRITKRIKMEVKRSGILGFVDVLMFRLYYKIFMAKRDVKYNLEAINELRLKYPEIPIDTKIHQTQSPNSDDTIAFLQSIPHDFAIARCKSILKEEVFIQAEIGTFVMHPGICPEYRNAHGCFWAMVNEDYDNIGMTLLKVDKGIDTGPIYGYFKSDLELLQETHNTIQAKVVFDNLDAIKDKFIDIYQGLAVPLGVKGRKSGTWGQPWLSKYLLWKNNYIKGLKK